MYDVRMVSEDYKTFAAGGEDRTRDAKNPTALPTALNRGIRRRSC